MEEIVAYRVELGAHIQDLRKSLGVSQETLAASIGKSRVFVGYIEQGSRTPSVATLLEISHALQVPMSKIFDFIWEAPTDIEYDSTGEGD